MSADILLAIDAGTGSCRAVLMDTQGDVLGVAQREWDHPAEAGVPGSQNFDTVNNWSLICACICEALDRASITADRIAGVSTTSMREGVVLYDGAGQEIWACPNVDARAGAEATELVRSREAETIYDLSGDWVSITSPARLLWLREHRPDIADQVRHLTMLSDWIVHRLCGAYATDPSVGSSSGMFDLSTRTWSEQIVEMCGFPADILPDVAESGTVVGAVHGIAAEQTGLREGTPVVLGGADTQLGLLGIGVGADASTIVGGSFWQTTAVTSSPVIDPQRRLRTLCHVLPGHWMIEGIGFWSGLSMRWFRDAFCDAEKDAARQQGIDPYVLMEELASEVPAGANGVLAMVSNVMNAAHWSHASPGFMQFDLLSPQTSGKKECIRALEEAAAYVALAHTEILESLLGIEFSQVSFTGGAAGGQLWPQIIADVLGRPVNVPEFKESTAIGAAICAGVGAGLFSDLKHGPERTRRLERQFTPDLATHDVYASHFASWREVYERQLELAEEGVMRSMWRGAGT